MAPTRHFDPGMHSPGYQYAHCLPTAGLMTPKDRDVYRFQRVQPLYGPDPCIGPNEGDLLCPTEREKRNDLMPPAGKMPKGDSVFRFYATRPTAPRPAPMRVCRCPAFSNNPPCTSLGSVTDPLQCPCINRMNVGQGQRHHVDQSLTHPATKSRFQSYENKFVENVIDETMNDTRLGAVAPTPFTMMTGDGGVRSNMATFGRADYQCQNPYYPSNYICRPVFDRKYLDDCPEQNGPSPDVYTFL